MRRAAWRIVCAGGYFAAGFHGTIGHSDVWNRLDAPNRYTFTVKDEGAAGQLGRLHDFFAALPFSRMQPFAGVSSNAVALAEPGKCYVVYLPHGGTTTVTLGGGGQRLAARWFNPRDGQATAIGEFPGTGERKFTPPDQGELLDWVLVLEDAAKKYPPSGSQPLK